MNRRHFMLCAAALALVPGAACAAPFASGRFTVEVRGNGPDVILIPGLSVGRSVWADIVRAVPGYRYHLVQVSGFAGEPARGNARGPIVTSLAAELARYIAETRLNRPAVIGHSMGGTLAMMLAADRPGLVGRIMVVDMFPAPAGLFGQTTGDASAIARGIAGLTETAGGQQLFRGLVNAFAPPGSTFRTSDPVVITRAMNELAAMDLTPRLPAIRVPMTIAYASPGAWAGPVVDQRFRQAYAGARTARFVRVDGSGHMVMVDQPARLAAAMREFLGR